MSKIIEKLISLFTDIMQKLSSPFIKYFSLFKKIDEIAVSRGRNPVPFRIITFSIMGFFWTIGLNISFFIPGGNTMIAFLVGIIVAAPSIFISLLIVKNCRPGNYEETKDVSFSSTRQLSVPCQLQITRKRIYYTWPFQ